LLKSPIR